MQPVIDRRGFLRLVGAGGAGLAVGCTLDPGALWNARPQPWIWLEIGASAGGGHDAAVISIPRCEMGQGSMTGLAMIVAEELDLDWAQVQVRWPPLEPEYGSLRTSKSSAIRTLWKPLREVGAAARDLMVRAAAEAWQVDAGECETLRGVVRHRPSGRELAYSAVATRAAALPLPSTVRVKSREEFKLIGSSAPRLDTPDKVRGAPVFGIDVSLPGMLVATVVHCPVFEGKLADLDAGDARAVPGVQGVFELDQVVDGRHGGRSAVAVVADSYWAARKGANALTLRWDEGKYADWDDVRVERWLRESGERVVSRGDVATALATSYRIEATYFTPYLAHAAMEPMNCTASLEGGRCHVWAPTQNPHDVREKAALASGLPERDVEVHITHSGGAFGRRGRSDFVAQAVQLAARTGAPVKLIWSREEDLRNDVYRPATLQVLHGGLDSGGFPVAWRQHIAGTGSRNRLVGGIDALPYAIPHKEIRLVRRKSGVVPTGPWRSVARSQNDFVSESFLDEIARTGGHDPVALRARLLRDAPRFRSVLELVAERAEWSAPPPEGRHRGVAMAEHFGSICAQVAEVSVSADGDVRVHRIVCVADCGQLVNPDSVIAQLEGAVIFGLSAALHGEIGLSHGRVEQSNFHDYPLLHMSETPPIEIHLVESAEEPTGAGEIGLPAVAPAVASAVFGATRQPVRSLPIRTRRG
jgi:isoquinoline 1-oxidoreductase beta subunit